MENGGVDDRRLFFHRAQRVAFHPSVTSYPSRTGFSVFGRSIRDDCKDESQTSCVNYFLFSTGSQRIPRNSPGPYTNCGIRRIVILQ